jgi:hypothetical protein
MMDDAILPRFMKQWVLETAGKKNHRKSPLLSRYRLLVLGKEATLNTVCLGPTQNWG